MRCSICGSEAHPVGPRHEIRVGHPVCRGPVCQYCYENKVLPAQRAGEPRATPTHHDPGEEEPRDRPLWPEGFWLYIADDGTEVTACDQLDLVKKMVLAGHPELRKMCEIALTGVKPPWFVETEDEI